MTTYATLLRTIALSVQRRLGRDVVAVEDLESAGAVGLVEAAAGFESYARTRIMGSMMDSVRDRDMLEARHGRYEDIALQPAAPGNLLERSTMLSDLWGAIQSELLSPRQRKVIELRIEHDLDQVEIAARIGISQKTVSREERKVVAALRSRLQTPAKKVA